MEEESNKTKRGKKKNNPNFTVAYDLLVCEAGPWARGKLSRQSICSHCPATLNKTSLLGCGHLIRGAGEGTDLARGSRAPQQQRPEGSSRGKGMPSRSACSPRGDARRRKEESGVAWLLPPTLSVYTVPDALCPLSDCALPHQNDPSGSKCQGISSSFLARPTSMLKIPLGKMS